VLKIIRKVSSDPYSITLQYFCIKLFCSYYVTTSNSGLVCAPIPIRRACGPRRHVYRRHLLQHPPTHPAVHQCSPTMDGSHTLPALSLIVTAAPCVSRDSPGRNRDPSPSFPSTQQPHPAVRYIPLSHPPYNCHPIRLILTRTKGDQAWTCGLVDKRQ